MSSPTSLPEVVADLYPPEKRASAMAIHWPGVGLGTALATIIGGIVATALRLACRDEAGQRTSLAEPEHDGIVPNQGCRHPELVSGSMSNRRFTLAADDPTWMLKQVRHDDSI